MRKVMKRIAVLALGSVVALSSYSPAVYAMEQDNTETVEFVEDAESEDTGDTELNAEISVLGEDDSMPSFEPEPLQITLPERPDYFVSSMDDADQEMGENDVSESEEQFELEEKEVEDSTIVASGNCGEDGGSNVKWKLTSAGTLIIYGKGATGFYSEAAPFVLPEGWEDNSSLPPWYNNYREDIKKVIVKEGVTEIGQLAFKDCVNLKSVSLPEGLVEIDFAVFENTAIKELVLPDSLDHFYAITIDQSEIQLSTATENAKLKIENNIVFSRDKKTLFYYPSYREGSYTVPDGVETISQYAFYFSKADRILLPNSLKTIGFRAFACSNIESIDIPDSVTEMDIGICTDCIQLKTASVGDSVTVLDGTFDWCENLKKCKIGKNVKVINGAFRGNESLKSVTLPKNLESLEWNAFGGCVLLETINLPSKLTKIEDGCFWETKITKVTIPESVDLIERYAFNPDTKIICPHMTKMDDGSYRSNSSLITFWPKVTYDQSGAREMLKMINDFRTGSDAWYYNSEGMINYCDSLSKFKYDYNLERAAMQRAAELVLSFSHTRPDGSDCFTAITGSYYYAGENIAVGQTTVQAAFESWQETNEDYWGQGHRRNMLAEDFNAIGIAHIKYQNVDYWVQEFGYSTNPDTNKTEAVNQTKKVKIVVYPENVDISSVSLKIESFGLGIGMTYELPKKAFATASIKATWSYANFRNASQKLTWSTKSKCVSIKGSKLTAVSPGVATLTTKAFGQLYSFKVTILPEAEVETAKVCTTGRIKLIWNAVEGAEKYRVFRRTNKGVWQEIGNTESTDFIDKTAKNNVKYYYTICCVNKTGNSYVEPDGSKEKTVIVRDTPKLTKVTRKNETVTLRWKAVDKVNNYRVYRKVAGGLWKLLDKTNKTSYTDKMAQNGVRYYYTVCCLSADGKQLLSGYDKEGLSAE